MANWFSFPVNSWKWKPQVTREASNQSIVWKNFRQITALVCPKVSSIFFPLMLLLVFLFCLFAIHLSEPWIAESISRSSESWFIKKRMKGNESSRYHRRDKWTSSQSYQRHRKIHFLWNGREQSKTSNSFTIWWLLKLRERASNPTPQLTLAEKKRKRT